MRKKKCRLLRESFMKNCEFDYVNAKEKMSPVTRKFYEKLRTIVPVFIQDTPKHEEIKRMKTFLQEINLTENFDLL